MNKGTQRELDIIARQVSSPLTFNHAKVSADILLRSAATAKASREIQAALAALGLSQSIRYL